MYNVKVNTLKLRAQKLPITNRQFHRLVKLANSRVKLHTNGTIRDWDIKEEIVNLLTLAGVEFPHTTARDCISIMKIKD